MTSDRAAGDASGGAAGGAPGQPADELARAIDEEVAASGQATGWQRLRPFLRPVLMLVISLIAAWIIVGLVGDIDWAAVGDGLGRLSLWQGLVLLLLLLIRQAFNAGPLALYVRGLGWFRSALNDLTANLVATIAPPPGDMVLRVSQFKSWGVNPVDGMAGVTLNMITFYAVRFSVPALGLLLIAIHGAETGGGAGAVASLLIAAAIIVTMLLILRGERLAHLVGRVGARVIGRFRAGISPDAWGDAVVDFRARMMSTVKRGLVLAMGSLLAMVLTDAVILVAALRFVGVGTDLLPTIDVVSAFLIAYPLTALPLAGLGVLDASLLAAWTEIAGKEYEAEIVAGLVVWRVVTLMGPLAMGIPAYLGWRHGARRAGLRDDDLAPAEEAS